ncbi:MAG: Gfo/Idh/MocA family oxidoreductase [Gammaproteobacteria bacterium]|nr:Gfo/Idh/MocA family oxidoreductase [Gammaproteobacteria bacterium]
MTKQLRFGTLGAAGITPAALTQPALENDDVVVAAVAARNRERAETFAKKQSIENVLDTYDDVINDSSLDVIYNPLPISHHKEYTIKALRAGKHVLCEKSFAMNADEARDMAAVAEETGLVLIEAFHYRYHPVFQRALEIVDSGVLGKLKHIDARFTVGTPREDNIRMILETGGGATMDMGCYPISWLRHITRQEPKVVSATAKEGKPQIDLSLDVEYELADGLTARTSGSMIDPGFAADLRITAENGELFVQNPLVPQMGNRIKLTVNGEVLQDEELTRRTTYAFQLEAFVDAVRNGTKLPTDAQDAIKQMEVIDAAYIAAGLKPRGKT